MIVLAAMFYALAVATFVAHGPWYIPLLWIISGTVLLAGVRKAGGLRLGRRARARDETAGSRPAKRARRSGNPAVRAGVEPPKET